MTVRAPMINGNTDSAETFRLALSGLWVPNSANNVRTGLTSTPVLTGTGNFTATVGPFTAIIDGTSNSLQGAYPVSNDAAATVTIGAANTQPRIDLISLQIQDNNYDGSGQLRGTFVVTAGTPSGSPVAPSAPANCIPLWTVPVAANATSITWASATAAYQRTAAAGGIVPVGVATDKPPVVNGVQYRHRLDVTAAPGSVSPLESTVDGVTYTPVFDPTPYNYTWQTFATVWTGSITNPVLNDGSLTMHYIKIGKLVTVNLFLIMGTATTYGSGTWYFSVPYAAVSSPQPQAAGSAVANTSSYSYGSCYAASAGLTCQFGTSGSLTPTSPGTWGSGNVLRATVAYETP